MVLPFWRLIPPKADMDTVLDHPNPACAVWCQHHHHKCWTTLVAAGPSAHVTKDPPCVFATNSHPAHHACLHRAQDWNIASISLLESMALFSHGFVLSVFPSPNLQPRCLQICDLMNLLFWLNKATHFQQDMRAQLVHLQASGIRSSANSFSPLEGRDKKLALLLLGPQTLRPGSRFLCRRHPASPGRGELPAPVHCSLCAPNTFTPGCFQVLSHSESPRSPPDLVVPSPALFHPLPLPAPVQHPI